MSRLAVFVDLVKSQTFVEVVDVDIAIRTSQLRACTMHAEMSFQCDLICLEFSDLLVTVKWASLREVLVVVTIQH